MPIWHKNHEWARVVVHLIGIGICGASAAVICSFLTTRPILSHLLNAICLFAGGLAFFLLSRSEDPGER